MERRSFHLDYENDLVHFKDGSPEADPGVQGSTRIPPTALAWEQSVTTPRPGQPFSGRTIWIRKLKTPLREFLRTETGGASVLLFAAIAALVWVNFYASSYDALWGTTLSIDVGGAGVALDLRHWVNSGLMTFFFFVLGLEARREFDLGELREHTDANRVAEDVNSADLSGVSGTPTFFINGRRHYGAYDTATLAAAVRAAKARATVATS